MNRIRIGRMLLAGLVTLLVFILLEFVWEGLIGEALFSDFVKAYRETSVSLHWNWKNVVINIGVALVNCVLMIWLYAALRPMFGVGPRNALITSGFVFGFVLSFSINFVNLGVYSKYIAFGEQVNLFVELPLSLIAGAFVYEAD